MRRAGGLVAAAALATTAAVAAAPSPEADAQELRTFTIGTTLLDEAWEEAIPFPSDFEMTYDVRLDGQQVPNEFEPGHPFYSIDAPAAGSYTVSIVPNAAAAAGSTRADFDCWYFDLDAPDEFSPAPVTPLAGGGWTVEVSGTQSTGCVEIREIVVPFDPEITTSILPFSYGEPEIVVGDLVGVLYRDGARVGVVPDLDDPAAPLVVEPGVYRIELEPSASAPADLDLSTWTITDWQCRGAGESIVVPNGGTFEVSHNDRINCMITASDFTGDLGLDYRTEGDIGVDWDGVVGEPGTEFVLELDVMNFAGVVDGTAPTLPVAVRVDFGDNTATAAEFVLSPGWQVVETGEGWMRLGYDGVLEPGETQQLRLGMVLTGATPTSAIRACVEALDFVERDLGNNCIGVQAVADGGDGDPGETPEPTPTPTPVETPLPTSTPTAPPTTTEPAAKADDRRGVLPATGAEPATPAILGLAAVLALAGGLLLASRRRAAE